jgi:hypothetical protein
VFGTRFLPSNRKPPLDIGCADPVPKKFLGQIAYPVTAWLKRQKM